MIRHVVLFKFKSGVVDAELTAWSHGLDRMRGNVPGLLSISHGPDIVRADRSFDYAIVADFRNRDAISVYDTHPLHEPLKLFSFPNSESIISVDFVINDAVKGDDNEDPE